MQRNDIKKNVKKLKQTIYAITQISLANEQSKKRISIDQSVELKWKKKLEINLVKKERKIKQMQIIVVDTNN